MKMRVILTVLWLAVLPGLNFYLHQALVPEQATDLALQQMNEDGSREKLRAIEQMSNWITLGLALAGVAGIGVIWVGTIKQRLGFKRRVHPQKSRHWQKYPNG